METEELGGRQAGPTTNERSCHAADDWFLSLLESATGLSSPEEEGPQLLQRVTDHLGLADTAFYLPDASGTLQRQGAAGELPVPSSLPPPVVDEGGSLLPWQDLWSGADLPLVQDGTIQGWAGLPLSVGAGAPGLLVLGPRSLSRGLDERERRRVDLLAQCLALRARLRELERQLQAQGGQVGDLRVRREGETPLRPEVGSLPGFPFLIGRSVALKEVLSVVTRVAPTDASVLITGETGTGKELVARALHELSPRRAGPLVSVNCAAIPLELAESELFGHERGAFTGAIETRQGRLEMADRGTIFLDEVADLPLSLQVKLLRVLQEREFQRVGSGVTRRLDLRVVAATNKDLSGEIRAGRFREDLYFRLATVPLTLPPLRDRGEDIADLANHFLVFWARRYSKPIRRFSSEALSMLGAHPWPGNVRELQNTVERAVVLATSTCVDSSDLPGLSPVSPCMNRFTAGVREDKMRRLQQAYDRSGGNKTLAARSLGMSRSNFCRLAKRYALRRPVVAER